MRRYLIASLILIALATSLAYTHLASITTVVDRNRHVTIVAVTQLQNGSYVGVTAELHVRVTCPGSGHVYVETLPLTQIDLQASTRVAALVASRVVGVDFTLCNYYASIIAESPIVGGPSASGVTAVAFASALLGLPMREDVVMTGMVMPDGSIGPVGGLKAKLEAAASRGAKVFLVPYGQVADVEYVTVTERRGSVVIQRVEQVVIDLVEYGRRLGVEVVPVANVYEALTIFSGGSFRVPRVEGGLEVIYRLRRSLDTVFTSWIANLTSEVRSYVALGDSIRDRALNSLRGVTATYIRNLVSDIESRIDSALSNARNLERQKLLYAAASSYFQALIYSKWRYNILNSILDSDYVQRLRRTINDSVYSIIELSHNMLEGSTDLTTLSVVANVLERAYDSILYLNASITTQEFDKVTYYLALADARAYTARLWLELVGYGLTGMRISINAIKDMSTFIKSLSYNLYSYMLALGGMQVTSNILDEAFKRYSLLITLNNPIDVFAVGLSTLSYIHVALTSMFTVNLSNSIEMINRTIAVSLAELGGSVPVDTLAYMELASAYASDPSTQLYMLSRLSMLLATYVTLRTLASEGRVVQTIITYPTQVTTVTIIKEVTVTVTRSVCPEWTSSKAATETPTIDSTYYNLSVVAAIVLLALIASLIALTRTISLGRS